MNRLQFHLSFIVYFWTALFCSACTGWNFELVEPDVVYLKLLSSRYQNLHIIAQRKGNFTDLTVIKYNSRNNLILGKHSSFTKIKIESEDYKRLQSLLLTSDLINKATEKSTADVSKITGTTWIIGMRSGILNLEIGVPESYFATSQSASKFPEAIEFGEELLRLAVIDRFENSTPKAKGAQGGLP